MGLETASFISGLTPSWPIASESKSQGDDHLRLIKGVLQGTFPAASKPFYFPKLEVTLAPLTLDPTDQNNVVVLDTTSGNVAINLPSTLGPADAGWFCEVMKVSTDANAGIVPPTVGSIVSKAGGTATIRVGIVCEPVKFVWHGSGWYCVKLGTPIGVTENFDGSSIPAGYLDTSGGSFSAVSFAELNNVLGGTTLPDKRGRVEAGLDGGTGRTGLATVGAAGGEALHTLLVTEIPPVTPSVASNSLALSGATAAVPQRNWHTAGGGTPVPTEFSNGSNLASSNGSLAVPVSGGTITGGITMNALGYTAGPHNNIQHTIATRKIIRAC